MKQYEAKINEILQAVQPAIEQCKEQIEATQAAVNKAREELDDFVLAGDPREYSAKLTNFNSTTAALEMLTTRLDALRNKPLINADKYENLADGILAEMAAKNEADKKEAAELCDKLLAIADRNLSMIEEGNDLLHRLQFDVYRAADCLKDKDGNVVLGFYGMPGKHFRDRNGLQPWAVYALRNCVQYKAWRKSIGLDS